MVDKTVSEFGGMSGNAFNQAFEDALEAAEEAHEEDSEQEEEENEAPEDEVEQEEDDEDTEDDDDEDSDESDKEEKSKEEDTEVSEEKVKDYKVTLDDGSQIDIKDNASLKVKVDGKFKRVTVRDLLSDFNGQVKADELIRQNSETAKQLRATNEKLTEDISRAKELSLSFVENLTKGDLIAASSVIAEMKGEGADANTLVNDMISGINKFIAEYADLSQEEIDKRAKNYKLDAELRKKEKALEKSNQSEAVKQAVAAKQQFMQELHLDEDTMNAAYQALANRNQIIEQEGGKPINFTVQDVAVLADEWRHSSGFKQVITKHELTDSDVSENDITSLIKLAQIRQSKKGSGLEFSDYAKLLNDYAEKELVSLSRKVGKKPPKTTPKRKKGKSKVREVTRIDQVWDI